MHRRQRCRLCVPICVTHLDARLKPVLGGSADGAVVVFWQLLQAKKKERWQAAQLNNQHTRCVIVKTLLLPLLPLPLPLPPPDWQLQGTAPLPCPPPKTTKRPTLLRLLCLSLHHTLALPPAQLSSNPHLFSMDSPTPHSPIPTPILTQTPYSPSTRPNPTPYPNPRSQPHSHRHPPGSARPLGWGSPGPPFPGCTRTRSPCTARCRCRSP